MEGRITKTENHDIYTKLMMHFNGNLYDSSRSGHSVSSIGGSLEASVKKFGSHSYKHTTAKGSRDALTWDGYGDLSFGTDDFTIDFWTKLDPSDTDRHTFINGGVLDLDIRTVTTPYNGINVYLEGSNIISDAEGVVTINDGAWHHVALVRGGGTLYLFVDGVIIHSEANSTDIQIPNTNLISIGEASSAHTTNQPLQGYIDELRISKGIARWTSGFHVPTEPYRGENSIIGSINTEVISISKHREGIILTDKEINQEEGTIMSWLKNSMPQPDYWWKLDDPQAGLILHNKLGSQAEVLSSVVGGDGTEQNSPSYAAGKFDNGFDQSGWSGTDRIDFSSKPYTGKGCLEVWLKPNWSSSDTPPGMRRIWYMRGSYTSIGAFWEHANRLRIDFYDSTPTYDDMEFTLTFSSGELFHLAVVWDCDGLEGGSIIKVYKNGVELSVYSSQSGSGLDDRVTSNTLYVGNYTSARGFDGVIDNLKYWNYAKTDFSDIEIELTPESRVAQTVSQGVEEVKGIIYGVSTEQSGFKGPCYKFAGTTSSYINLGNNVHLESDQAFSFSFWINTNKGSWYAIVGKGVVAGGATYLMITYDGGTELEISLSNSHGSNMLKSRASCQIDDGNWHHYVITYDGSKTAANVRFYEDGKLQTTLVEYDTLTGTIINTADFWIGKSSDSASGLNGYLSDFRIYRYELVQEDVDTIYQDIRTLISMDELPRPIHHFPCDKPYSYDIGTTAKFIQDKGTTVHLTDNHKKAVNITPSTGYLEATAETADFERTEPFSFCWWYKTSTAGWRYILTKYDGGTGILIGATTNGSPPDILVRLRNTSGQEVRLTARGIDGVLDDGTWHHIAITYNGNSDVSGVQFYVDGRLLTDRNIVTNTLASTIKNTANFKFGTFGTGSDTVDSDYSDVRIYNVELTQEQVTKIMNETPFGVSTKENSSEMVIESRPEDGLVLWNKLGNPYEVEHSVVGYNMTEVSSPSYVNAKFGQGFNSVNNTNYITGRYVALDQGCVECWIKPHFGPTNSTVYQFITSADSGVTNVRGPLLYWKSNTDKWSFVWVNTSGSAFYCDSSFAGFDSAEELVHIACVWDKEGIAGSSDTLRIYVNGSLKDNSTSSISDGNDGAILYIGKHPTISDRFGNCVFDNIKVWDYAKIDFSDRNTEGTSPHNLIPDLNDWKHIGVTWKETQKAGLLYWNKLGSDKESVNPEVGLETVLTGSATYGTSKFGYGIGFADYNNYLTVADLDISYAAGAFECWFKVRSNWNDAQSYIGLSTTNAVQPYPILGYSRYDDRWVAYFYANSKKQKIYLLVSGLGSDDPAKFSTGDIIHFAVSWDFSRAGVEKDRISLFINGVDRTSECGVDTNTTNTWDQYTMEGTRLGGAQGWGADWSMYGYMSNVKIWDYEKTDFSDRFHEAPAEVTKKLFIDGEKQQELVIDGPVYLPEKGLILGANQLLNRQGSVLMDNIVVSKREFTEKEIRRLYLSKYIK